MAIKVINPINVGRGGRRDNFRSLTEIKLDVDELQDDIKSFKRQVDRLERMLAKAEAAGVTLRRTTRGKTKTIKGRGRTRAAPKQRKAKAKPAKVQVKAEDLDKIRSDMALFKDAVAIRKRLRNTKAELTIRSELRRTRDYKAIARDISGLEKKLSSEEGRAFKAVSVNAAGKAPKELRDLMSDLSVQLRDDLEGLFEGSSESLLVDVNDKAKKPGIRFTYYLTLKNMKSADSGFRYPTAVAVLVHDLSEGADRYRVNLLSEYKHPDEIGTGAPVTNADRAAKMVMDKLKARGLMEVLTDDDVTPFGDTLGGKKFPGVAEVETDDDERTISFKMRAGTDPSAAMPKLRAALFSIMETSHPGHLLQHRIEKDTVVFRIDKDTPYLANRQMADRVAEMLEMSDAQRKSWRDWIVQNMMNEPEEEEAGWKLRYLAPGMSEPAEIPPNEQLDWIRNNLLSVEGEVEGAAVETISTDGPRHLYEPSRPRMMQQRSIRTSLERLAGHFKGDLIPPGDFLYGIAKAIPGANLQARIVLLTRPGSIWVDHAVLLNEKMDKMLVDHNAFLATEWKPSQSLGHKNPEKWGEYRAVQINGSRHVFKPRKAMTVAKFIKESETYFAVRTIQLKKKRNRPRRPKPAAKSPPKPKVREKAAAVPPPSEVELKKGKWPHTGKQVYYAVIGGRRYHTPLFPPTDNDKAGKLGKRWVFDDWDWPADEGDKAKREFIRLVKESVKKKSENFMAWWNGELSDTAASAKAGILPWMISGREFHVLILRPGGPDYRGRKIGHWTIAKGGIKPGEQALEAALREFREETGIKLPADRRKALKELGREGVMYPNLRVWTVNLNGPASLNDTRKMTSNTFDRGGESYPEIDGWKWATVEQADKLMDPRLFGLVQQVRLTIDPSFTGPPAPVSGRRAALYRR